MTASAKRNRRHRVNGPAENNAADLRGSQRQYSYGGGNATTVERYYGVRRAREDPANDRITKALFGRSRPDRYFDFKAWRLMEIMRVIRARYGRFLPENDGPEFFEAVAAAYQAGGSANILGDLRGWCWCAAPWACDLKYAGVLAEVAASVAGRRRDLRADAIANLLRVTMAERLALGLQTIGACDVVPEERQKIMKDRKMENDRARQRAKRVAEGRQDRAEYEANSFSRTKPWEAAGISRRTWERRRVASVSKQEDIQFRDTPASSAPNRVEEERTRPRERPESISTRSASMQAAEPSSRRAAKRSGAEGRRERMRASPAEAAVIRAVFDRIHDPNVRWIPAPGSSTDMVAA